MGPGLLVEELRFGPADAGWVGEEVGVVVFGCAVVAYARCWPCGVFWDGNVVHCREVGFTRLAGGMKVLL